MKFLILTLTLLNSALADESALRNTQQMLKSKQQRNAAIKDDKIAVEIDKKVETLAGTEQNKEEIYDLASQLLETISREAKGDPEKMSQLLMEAQSNPQAFYEKYFTPEQKAKVRGIATNIENQKTPTKPRK